MFRYQNPYSSIFSKPHKTPLLQSPIVLAASLGSFAPGEYFVGRGKGKANLLLPCCLSSFVNAISEVILGFSFGTFLLVPLIVPICRSGTGFSFAMARIKIPAMASLVTQQSDAGMAKTKIPATTSAKNKQHVGYVSRQVVVLLGDSSDYNAGPSRKGLRDEVAKSSRKEKKQQTVPGRRSNGLCEDNLHC
ncbi:unnamed protein product [Linum tenue]|uniref:Uncharacterized protein n=1 Tax=Linum tenue TaxID=586396 RepID=A0AAV0IWX0_9ROSI|nr:unnamed protein product [Linum tenue]